MTEALRATDTSAAIHGGRRGGNREVVERRLAGASGKRCCDDAELRCTDSELQAVGRRMVPSELVTVIGR